jgi:hypothetical protein
MKSRAVEGLFQHPQAITLKTSRWGSIIAKAKFHRQSNASGLPAVGRPELLGAENLPFL